MADNLANVNEPLRLGIEAVRAGQNNLAFKHLAAVLRREPDNIRALLWLAYALPSPQDGRRALNRALALEPGNERAKAGLRWVEDRLAAQPGQPGGRNGHRANFARPGLPAVANPDQNGAGSVSLTTGLASFFEQSLNLPGLPVWLVRRASKPRLVMAGLVALLALIITGFGARFFALPDSSAAWLLPSTSTDTSEVAAMSPAVNPEQPGEARQVPIIQPLPSEMGSALETRRAAWGVDELTRQTKIIAPDLPAQATSAPSLNRFGPSEIGPTLPLPETEPNVSGPANLLDVEPKIESESVDPARLTHQPAYPGQKWIEVNVTTQEVTAWEGNVPAMSFIVSTGLPKTPTVLGEFRIYWKLASTLMTGPGYYLPDVPYTMYFYQGYALHGTYWHDNFGQPMSRGCVNFSIEKAKALFEWADPVIPPGQTQVRASANNPGTLVVVHD